ncbi:MAG: isochorismate synthase [bacterium]
MIGSVKKKYCLQTQLTDLQTELFAAVDTFFSDIRSSFKPLFYFSCPVLESSLLLWLDAQVMKDRLYWQHRDGLQCLAGVGVAKSFDDLTALESFYPVLKEYPFLKVFFRTEFGFGHCDQAAFEGVLPLFSVSDGDGECRFCCQFLVDEKQDYLKQHQWVTEQIGRLLPVNSLMPHVLPRAEMLSHFPEFDQWNTQVSSVMKSFSEASLKKIVLSRKTTLSFSCCLSLFSLASLLLSQTSQVFVSLWQREQSKGVLCFSPELLFERHGLQFCCDVMAGTRSRGASFDEDAALEEALLQSEKDVYEHSLVREGLMDSLRPFVTRCEALPMMVKKMSHVQHLYQLITGQLTEVDDWTLLQCLSPSAAVGAVPKNEGLAVLSAIEGFDRSWYAGCFGVLDGQSMSVAVSIRMAVLTARKLILHAGAGIVPGSVAEDEWEELNSKIKIFLRVLT